MSLFRSKWNTLNLFKYKNMFKDKRGFTLIELIIVMAIIGVLAVVGIVAISGKAQEARNVKRKSDMSRVITMMQVYCSEKVTPEECPNDGSNKNVLANCKDPGKYLDLKTITDPSNKDVGVGSRCNSLNAPCNYTVSLTTGMNAYNQCDPKILFALEDGTDWKSGCAKSNGISFNIDQKEFNECQ